MKTLIAVIFVIFATCVSAADSDDFVTCVVEDTYDTGATTCYVDSVNGNDSNNGLSEASPVKSQSAIVSQCTVVRFKRGSVFNEKLAIPTYFNNIRFGYNVKVYANYGPKSDPLPQFKVSSEPGRGPVVLSFSPLTIDGLHFSGARGDNTMEHDFDSDRDGITKGIVGGIGAFLGAATTFINNEIDDCDIGIMLGGAGSVVRGNYVHDLIMGIDEAPGVDPNLVGGAEGIFINASNSEVSYNSFINCTGPARWVGSNGDCDGGATEISAASGGTIENVHVHHNYSNNSCGFLEIASYFGDQGKGLFKNSSFHNNLIVDSAWMGLLQVNNTDLENIHFYNNTLIQHRGSLNEGILWIIFTATSSGMEGGSLVPGTVHLTNNLYVLDGVTGWGRLIDSAFDTKNNIVVSYSGATDPNYVDLGYANIAGTTASDFDLVNSRSPAVDAGIDMAGNTLDYFNRARPAGHAPDIGAMEFGASQIQCIPPAPPKLETAPITSVTPNTATGGGNITTIGGSPVIFKGICWSTFANPGRANTCTNNGDGMGVFAASMAGLSANTRYHIRAYATNAIGTAYGADMAFTTTSPDFAVKTGTNGSYSAATTAGSSAVYHLALNGLTSYSGSAGFSCSGLPSGATCSFNPAPLSFSGLSAVPFTVTIATAARNTAAGINWKGFSWDGSMTIVFTLGALIVLICTPRRRRLSLATLLLFAIGLAACGGGGTSKSTKPSTQGTPAGTYAVVLTTTSGSISHNTNLTLTIN
jgi:hypothetical protein